MPELVKMYIRHTLIGFAAAAVFVALLFWFNIGNLWHLVAHDPAGWLAALMLVTFNGIVFSGVQFGIAVMGMANAKANPGGPGSTPRNTLSNPVVAPILPEPRA